MLHSYHPPTHSSTHPPAHSVRLVCHCHFQRCCYKAPGVFEPNRPGAGTFLLHHPLLDASGYYLQDELPKQRCCEESSLCSLYYDVRPVGVCQRAFIIIIGGLCGVILMFCVVVRAMKAYFEVCVVVFFGGRGDRQLVFVYSIFICV